MIFADTSALFALLVRGDAHHPDAVGAETGIRTRREQVWTIDPVLTELWLLLRREVGAHRSDALVSGLLHRGLLREPLLLQDYEQAWAIAEQWPDQRFSLADRQAFAAIERGRQWRAWSYDDDFAVIRLGHNRDQPIILIR